MRSKLMARVLLAALLAALLHPPAQAAPSRGLSWSQAASWWDWLEQVPRRVLGWQGKQGPGVDPDGVQRKAGPGVDPDGSPKPAPTSNTSGGLNDAGPGVDPNG